MINIFPGVEEICRKNLLNKHLSMMKKKFPHYYNFLPKTWLLPSDMPELKQEYDYSKTYILKPDNNC